jgi:hypothetical protein
MGKFDGLKNVIVYSISIILLISVCCKKNEVDKENENMMKQIYEMMGEAPNPDEEKVILLSFKYKLNEQIVESILDEYLTKYDEHYLTIKEAFDGKQYSKAKTKTKENIKSIVLELSTKYELSSATVASLIFDYLLWDRLDSVDDF